MKSVTYLLDEYTPLPFATENATMRSQRIVSKILLTLSGLADLKPGLVKRKFSRVLPASRVPS